MKKGVLALLAFGCLFSILARADTIVNTGNPDGKMGMSSGNAKDSEAADDFILTSNQALTSATFTGLLPTGFSITGVTVEIYRVFPKDSNVARTSGPPMFSTTQVPTRVNSPSDVEFVDRSTSSGNLSFTTSVLNNRFTVNNSVDSGIHPKPNQTTGGDGPVTGEEVQFAVNFTTPIGLAADHYFFVPQVSLSDGDFLWLSAPRPIVPPGTPFSPDLQTWIRDNGLAPDWLRVGTDIVGGTPAPTFNAAFTINAIPIPEPTSAVLLISGAVGLWRVRKHRVDR